MFSLSHTFYKSDGILLSSVHGHLNMAVGLRLVVHRIDIVHKTEKTHHFTESNRAASSSFISSLTDSSFYIWMESSMLVK